MLDDGPTASSVRGHFRAGEYASSMCPYLDLEGNYLDYLHRLSGKMRGNLVKGRRKLEEQGCVLRELRTPDEVVEGLRTLRMLSDSRWDSENVLSLPGMMDLVENVVHELVPSGEVIFYELDIREKPIAIAMGFQYEGKYMQYLTGFDTESSKFSPGTILLSMIIELLL